MISRCDFNFLTGKWKCRNYLLLTLIVRVGMTSGSYQQTTNSSWHKCSIPVQYLLNNNNNNNKQDKQDWEPWMEVKKAPVKDKT